MDAFQRKSLFMLIAGRLISLFGSGIQGVAIPLFILDLTGSGTMMGIFTLVSMVPALALAPLSGVLGDRYNRKTLMILADFARGGVVLILAGLAYTNQLSIYHLLCLQIFVSLLDSLFNASSEALIPDLVPRDDLPRANAFKGGSDSIAMIVGPLSGGIIYGVWGIKAVFLINALSFFASAVFEMFLRYQKTTQSTEKLTVELFVRQIREVLTFTWKQNGLKQLFAFGVVMNALTLPIFFIIMPYLLKQQIGISAEQFGTFQSTFIFGLLLGNIIFASFLAKRVTGKFIKTMILGQNVFIVIISLFSLPVMVKMGTGGNWGYLLPLGSMVMGLGIFNAFANIPISTNMQKLVGTEIRSRFFSIAGLFFQLATPFGCMIMGVLLDIIPVYFLAISVALLVMIIGVTFVLLADKEALEPGVAEKAQEVKESGAVTG